MDVPSTLRALTDIPSLSDRTATAIVMRALHWPDAFPATDLSLQRATGVSGARELRRVAEQWRPWRSYAAVHLMSATGSPLALTAWIAFGIQERMSGPTSPAE